MVYRVIVARSSLLIEIPGRIYSLLFSSLILYSILTFSAILYTLLFLLRVRSHYCLNGYNKTSDCLFFMLDTASTNLFSRLHIPIQLSIDMRFYLLPQSLPTSQRYLNFPMQSVRFTSLRSFGHI